MKEDKKYLSKSIHDASWRLFMDLLTYKAEEAGRIFIKVNPAYTSQDCSECNYRVKKKLSERIHNCPNCGLIIDRDLNASKNIRDFAFGKLYPQDSGDVKSVERRDRKASLMLSESVSVKQKSLA